MIGPKGTGKLRGDLELEQAREVVTNIDYFARDTLVSACLVIEAKGEASERADFQALRQILEDQGD